jgi:energy-converting hydrogenase A subunit R
VKRAFISDCEGPISKNDNAYEVTSHFIPNGGKLFTVISRYDDVLADVLKKPDYKAGYSLKLVLPLLKAYNVTDQKMREFSAKNLVLIPDARATMEHVRSVAHAFIVSTSYEHYIEALCRALGFPSKNTRCTRVRIDKYRLTELERTRLRDLSREILRMAAVEILPNADSMQDFSKTDQKTLQRLGEIFWEEIAGMKIGRIYSEVEPMGAGEKASAVETIARELGLSLADVMYVGDSITDEDAFKLVKGNGGLTVSFNGNEYAVKTAEIAVTSSNTIVTAIIADIFCKLGKRQTLKLTEHWSIQALKNSGVDSDLLEGFFRLGKVEPCSVEIVTPANVDRLARRSSEFRLKVRGQAIGRLG